jgi:hypothetical protein
MGSSIKVSQNASPEDLEKAMAKKFKGKRNNISKFFGKLKLNINPKAFQKKIRNEWD